MQTGFPVLRKVPRGPPVQVLRFRHSACGQLSQAPEKYASAFRSLNCEILSLAITRSSSARACTMRSLLPLRGGEHRTQSPPLRGRMFCLGFGDAKRRQALAKQEGGTPKLLNQSPIWRFLRFGFANSKKTLSPSRGEMATRNHLPACSAVSGSWGCTNCRAVTPCISGLCACPHRPARRFDVTARLFSTLSGRSLLESP